MTEPDPDTLRTLLQLHRDVAQDTERFRYWYSSVFAAIIGALLVVLNIVSSRQTNQTIILYLQWITAFSIFFLSMSGVVINLDSSFRWYYNATNIRALLKKLNAEDWDFETYNTPLSPDTDIGFPLLINSSFWYSLIFGVILCLSIGAFFYLLFGSIIVAVAISFTVFIVLFWFVNKLAYREFNRIENHVEEKSKNEIIFKARKNAPGWFFRKRVVEGENGRKATKTVEENTDTEPLALLVGDHPRVHIVAAVLDAGPQGLSTSEIIENTGFKPATVHKHLDDLQDIGIVMEGEQTKALTIYKLADYNGKEWITGLKKLRSFMVKEIIEDE